MKKQRFLIFLISIMSFLLFLPVADAEANPVAETGLAEQKLPASDQNDALFYTTVKESVSGSRNYHSFNILGSDGGMTTSHNQGYSVCVGTSRESAAANVIEAENGKVCMTDDNLLVQPLFHFTQGGKFVKVTYRIYNPNEVTKKVYLSVDADLGGNESNYVPVVRTATGFLMQNKYYVHIKDVAGSTDADTLWFGDYTERKENRWNDCAVDSVDGVDSGMVFSWQDREIAPKCMREFSFLIGVSETPESVVENREVAEETLAEQNAAVSLAVSELQDEKARTAFGADEGLLADDSFVAMEQGEKLWYTTVTETSYMTPMRNANSFNVWGLDKDGKSVQSTYASNGYNVYVGTEAWTGRDNNRPDIIKALNGMVQNTGEFQVQPRITITEDGNFVRVVYRVYNPSDVAKSAYVAVDADIQISSNDYAPITRTATGFLMQDDRTTSGYQFNVHVKNAYGVTDVDNLWFGYFNDRYSGRWTNCTIDTLQNKDSGMGISWVDREIAPGTYQDFSFLVGIGEAAMPMTTDITLSYDEREDSEGKTWVDVLAHVQDAEDRNYRVYYAIQDGDGQVLAATCDGDYQGTQPINATGSTQTVTGKIEIPREWSQDSVYKVQVWVMNDRSILSDVETIYVKKKFELLYEPGMGSTDWTAAQRTHRACAGESLVLPEPDSVGITPPKGYQVTFAGWQIEDTVYQAGESFTMPLLSENGTTAVALWQEQHIHDYGEPVWEWNEDFAEAIATFTCDECGDVQVRQAAIADSTITRVVNKEATCTQDGEIEYRAKVIFNGNVYTDSKTENAGKLGHDMPQEWEIVAPSSCEKGGSERRACTRCHMIETRNLDPLGHDWDSEYTVDLAPTCEQDGSKSLHCRREDCGARYESVPIEALGHDWKETGRIEPACNQEGYVEYVCANDSSHSYREVLIDPEGHTPGDVWTVLAEPTCTEEGREALLCINCHAKLETRPLAPVGHDWQLDYITEPTCAESGMEHYVCTHDPAHVEDRELPETGKHQEPDHWENDVESHWHICVNCNKKLSESESAHRESDWMIDREPDYEAAGQRHTECTVCGRILRKEEIPMLVRPGTVIKDIVKGNETAPEASFNNPVEELKEKLLEDEEKLQVEEGENARIYLEITDINDTITELDGMKIAQKVPNAEEIYFLDLSLYKQIGNEAPVFLSNPGTDISITLSIPERMRAADRTYRVVRLHDGAAEYVDGTYHAEDYTFTFTTDRFSTYALAYDGKVSTPPETPEVELPTSPETMGGYALDSGMVIFLGMLCFAVLLFAKRKI